MKSWQPFNPLKKVPNSAPATGIDKLKAATPLPFFDKLRLVFILFRYERLTLGWPVLLNTITWKTSLTFFNSVS